MALLDSLRPPEPLERRELGVLGLFAIVALTQGWAGAVVTHALPFVQDDLGLSDAAIFDLMAIIRAASLLALALSWWGDHRGRRKPLLASFAVLTAANLATVFVPGMGGFTAAQSAARIGTIGLASLALVVLAEEIRPAIRGYAIGLYALVGAMGTGLGLLLRPLGEGGDAWRVLFALSAVPLVAFPFLAGRLGESRAFRRPPSRPPLAAVFRAGHARRFWPMAVLAFALSAFTAPAANLALVRLENTLGWSAGAASVMLALTSAPGVTIGLLAGGRMADLLGRRPTEAVAIGVGVGGGLAFYLLDQGLLMGAGILASNLGAFAFAPAFASHRSELFPTDLRATASAWITNAGILGGLGGFAAGRFVVDEWGIPTTITVLGCFLLVASLVILLLPETKGVTLTGEPGADPLATPGAMPG